MGGGTLIIASLTVGGLIGGEGIARVMGVGAVSGADIIFSGPGGCIIVGRLVSLLFSVSVLGKAEILGAVGKIVILTTLRGILLIAVLLAEDDVDGIGTFSNRLRLFIEVVRYSLFI